MMAATKNTKAFYNSEIPSDWKVKKLGDVGKIRMCKRIFNHETTEEGDIPFFKIGTFGKEPDAFIPKELYDNYRKKFSFPKKGEILISAAGTLGRTVVYDGSPAYFQDSNIVWIDNSESTVINQYLFYVYQIVKYESEGGTIQRLYNSIISSAKFPCPPLSEQKAIAQVLSTADATIHTTEKLIAKKELRKKWLMQQLLSEKRIVKNEKWCKSGVKEVFLKDVAKVTMGQSPNSEDYNTDKDGLPLIQGNADLNERKQVVRYWTSQSNKECDSGDIIMTVRAPVGAIGLATQKSSIGRGVCSIKPKNIDYWYLYHLLVYKEEQWKKLEQGSTFTAVGSKDIFHFSLFIVHSLEEQTAIAQVLQAADKEISLLKAKAAKLREQKKGMMQLLLTGKIRLIY